MIDILPLISSIIQWTMIATIIFLFIVVLKSAWYKQKFGEIKVQIICKLNLDTSIYRQFNNLVFLTDEGSVQIDHLIVSKFGIFVIETKNMTGWIFGDENALVWTQIIKAEDEFENPVQKNHNLIQALQGILTIDEEKFFSIIAFVGSAILKTRLPDNVVLKNGFIRYIKSKHVPILKDEEVEEIIESIEANRLRKAFETEQNNAGYLNKKFALSEKNNFIFRKNHFLYLSLVLFISYGIIEILNYKKEQIKKTTVEYAVKIGVTKGEDSAPAILERPGEESNVTEEHPEASMVANSDPSAPAQNATQRPRLSDGNSSAPLQSSEDFLGEEDLAPPEDLIVLGEPEAQSGPSAQFSPPSVEKLVTQDQPSVFEETTLAQEPEPEKPGPAKKASSYDFCLLKVSAQEDTVLTLYNKDSRKKIVSINVKKGLLEEFEIKKGYYIAETIQSGTRKIQSISVISNVGKLNL